MKIIIINGPIGVGKTTLAKGLHEQLSQRTFLLGVDLLRSQVSYWKDDKLAVSHWVAKNCLSLMQSAAEEGYDVIFEKAIAGAGHENSAIWFKLFQSIESFAKEKNIEIKGVNLTASREVLFERYVQRRKNLGATIEEEKFTFFYKNVTEFMNSHEDAHNIDTTELTQEEVQREALAYINK